MFKLNDNSHHYVVNLDGGLNAISQNYYGTSNQIIDFINARKESMCDESNETSMIESQLRSKAMPKAKIIRQKTFTLNNYAWTHDTKWRDPYHFSAKAIYGTEVLFQLKDGTIVRCVLPTFQKLTMQTPNSKKAIPMDARMWGNSGVYDYDESHRLHRSRLYHIEQVYNRSEKKQAIADLDRSCWNFENCMKDFIGDI